MLLLDTLDFTIQDISNLKGSFCLRNRPLEWNDYSIKITILMFGMDLFLGIHIPIGIPIPLRRGIPIPLKNERNSYSNENRLDFLENTLLFFILFQFCFFKKKKKDWKIKTPPPLNSGCRPPQWVVSQPQMVSTTLGVIWGWPDTQWGWPATPRIFCGWPYSFQFFIFIL
jgi:hypothetical protein